MGVWTVSIGGTDVTTYVQKGASFDHQLNARPVMRCTLMVKDGDLYDGPVERQVVIVEDDLVRVFGGIVWRVKRSPIVDYFHRRYDVDIVGYEALTDKVLFNGPVPSFATSGTLKDMLTEVMNNMVPHGMAVDGGMSDGPTLDQFAFSMMTVRQCIDALSQASGWNVRFGWFGEVLMQDPGTLGSPFDLVDTTRGDIVDLDVERSLANYVNEVWIRFGDSSIRRVSDTFLGDGTTKTFALHYTPSVTPGSIVENGVTYPVATFGATGYRWYYRISDNAMVVDAAAAAPTNGHVIEVSFDAQFPGLYFVRDDTEYAAKGPWTIVIDAPEIFEWTQARYAAQGELDRRVGVVDRIKLLTMRAGLEPGMTVEVTATKLDIASGTDFLIIGVRAKQKGTTLLKEQIFQYEIDAIAGNQYQRNWLDYFYNLKGGSGGGGTATGGGTVTSVSSSGSSKAYWGGSMEVGKFAASAVDVVSGMPVRLDGGDGSATVTHTVRVFRKTFDAGTSVTARVLRVDTSAVMVTGSATTSTTPNEELLVFTLDSGARDYKLQMVGGNGNAEVYVLGASL
jgi:hypothetical protein